MIPDPIERLEAQQEKVMHAQAYDAATNTMECAMCGKRFDAGALEQIYNHPASALACRECLKGSE